MSVMAINLVGEERGYSCSLELPLSEEELNKILSEEGMDFIDQLKTFKENEISITIIVNDSPLKGQIWNQTSLTELNLAMRIYENLDDYQQDKMWMWQEERGFDDAVELINVAIQVDDIETYPYDYDDDDRFTNYAKTRYGSEVSDDVWDYVDWYGLGRDAEGVILRDDYYLYDDYLDDNIDLAWYTLEEVIDREDYEVEEPNMKSLTVHRENLKNTLLDFLEGGGQDVAIDACSI